MNDKTNKLSLENIRKRIGSSSALILVLVVLCIIFQMKNPLFFTFDNVIAVLRQLSIYGVVGIGMGVLLLNGYLDLTVGSIVGFCGVLVSILMTKAGIHPVLAILLTLAAGAAVGAFNGTIITITGIPPFIFTLAMTAAYRGIIYLITGGKTISGFSDGFLAIGRKSIFKIPIPILIFFVVLFITWFLLNRTVFGRGVYLCGGNPTAARYSGLNVKKTAIISYAICGMTAAIAGIILAAKLASAQPTMGNSYEMEAISVAAIGGISLSGGVGSITGVLLGALILGVIDNGMIMMGITSYWQMVIKGVVIVAAVIFDIYRKNK